MGDAPVMDYLAPSAKYKYQLQVPGYLQPTSTSTTVALSHLCCIVSKELTVAKKYSFIASNIFVMDDSGTKATCRQKADLTPKGIRKNVTIYKRSYTVDTENLQMLVPVEDFEHI